jgi:hypothetical protein
MPEPRPARCVAEQTIVGALRLREVDCDRLGIERPAVDDAAQAAALDAALAAVVADAETGGVLAEAGADVATLRRIHEALVALGAAHWVKGQYVPVAALLDPYPLAYLLKLEKRGGLTLMAINQVLGFFDGLTQRLVLPEEASGSIIITRAAKK